MLDAITGALGWSLGGIVAVLGALAAWTVARRRQRAQGRTDERQKRAANVAKAEEQAHERITDADTGGGDTDAERVRDLNAFADKLRRD